MACWLYKKEFSATSEDPLLDTSRAHGPQVLLEYRETVPHVHCIKDLDLQPFVDGVIHSISHQKCSAIPVQKFRDVNPGYSFR